MIKSDLEWIIAKISNHEAPHAQGATVRRRIFNTVNKIAEVDENSGCLRKVTDTEKLIDKIANCITGAETVPYLDSLLLTAQTSQRVLKILLARFTAFVKLLIDNSLDREVTLRLLAIPRMCDPEVLGSGTGIQEFSDAIKKLIEDTIDPCIRKQAVEVSGELDALLVLASAKTPALTSDQLIEGIKTGSLCLKCDTTTHNECDLSPTVCLNCRGDRTVCIRSCAKACRVCGSAHPGRSIITCLEETVHGGKKRKLEEEEPEEKRMRSVREYKEAKRRQKVEKKSVSPVSFEKLLKDTVAKSCYDHIGDRPGDKEAEIPEWRRVYRTIAGLLLEKEARLPEEVRFRCSMDDERASVIKRVRQYCDKHFNKHVTTS